MKTLSLLFTTLLTANAFAANSALYTNVPACVQGYLEAWDKVPQDEESMRLMRRMCLSDAFAKKFKRLSDAQEADALLNAQDSYPSWKKSARITSVAPDERSVTLVLGRGKEAYCLRLGVSGPDDGWRITSSAPCLP